jgi:hypothetical protein
MIDDGWDRYCDEVDERRQAEIDQLSAELEDSHPVDNGTEVEQ